MITIGSVALTPALIVSMSSAGRVAMDSCPRSFMSVCTLMLVLASSVA